MSNRCEWTGCGPASGNLVSHSNIKTRTRWNPNTQRKRYEIVELGQTLTLRLSTRAIRTIDKLGGLVPALRKAREDQLSPRLQKLRVALSARARRISQGLATKEKPVVAGERKPV